MRFNVGIPISTPNVSVIIYQINQKGGKLASLVMSVLKRINLVSSSFRNRLFGFDPNSIADDSGDDMRKVEADNTGVIPSDFQVSEKRSLTTMNSDCDCQVKVSEI